MNTNADPRACQGIIVLTVPAVEKAIAPPHMQMHLDVLSSAGILAINTVGAPGIQGVTVMGMQGIGTSTPNAAAVAAATTGFAIELQTPNGKILSIGTWSMILAAGGPSASTLLSGKTTKADGATPNVQVISAPMET